MVAQQTKEGIEARKQHASKILYFNGGAYRMILIVCQNF
jgi:hypothetical protein